MAVVKRVVVASGLKSAMSSFDGGKTWEEMKMPEGLTQLQLSPWMILGRYGWVDAKESLCQLIRQLRGGRLRDWLFAT